MTILWLDGFDHYPPSAGYLNNDLADAGYLDAEYTLASTFGRTGASSVGLTSNGFVRLPVPQRSTLIVGSGIYYSNSESKLWEVLRFQHNTGSAFITQILLRKTTENKLEVVDQNYTQLAISTEANTVRNYAWEHIEIKVQFGVSGSVVVRVNGKEVINATGVNTDSAGVGTANTVHLGKSRDPTMYYDDLYVCDTLGTVNNDFLGDVKIYSLYPDGAGANSAWTPAGAATNWEAVDDGDAGPNDDTDYVGATSAGLRDTYAFEDLPGVVTEVLGVAVVSSARKEDSGDADIRHVVGLSGTEVTSSVVPLSVNFQHNTTIHETKPGGGSWTPADVEAAEFGVESV